MLRKRRLTVHLSSHIQPWRTNHNQIHIKVPHHVRISTTAQPKTSKYLNGIRQAVAPILVSVRRPRAPHPTPLASCGPSPQRYASGYDGIDKPKTSAALHVHMYVCMYLTYVCTEDRTNRAQLETGGERAHTVGVRPRVYVYANTNNGHDAVGGDPAREKGEGDRRVEGITRGAGRMRPGRY